MTPAITTGPIARVRWHAPDGRTGAWGRALDALVDAVRVGTGQAMDPLKEWENVTRLWRQLQGQGWELKSERAWE